MLRTTSCVINVKTYLFCRRPRDFQISPISRLPPTNSVIDHRPRKPCPVPAPPPQQPVKDNRWLWGGLAVLVIAGCGIMCAHESPEIRDWLTLYAPWIDDFIAILYQENMTYGEIACQCLIEIKKYIATIKTDLEKRIYPEQNAIADVSRQARIRQSDDDESVTTRSIPTRYGSVSTGDQRMREPCPIPPPPPPKPPKDDTWFWATVAALFISGVGIVAAKNSPEVRDWMTLYAPWVDDFIAIVYEENMTYGEFINKCIEDLRKYIVEFNDEKLPKECSTDGKAVDDVAEEVGGEEEDEEEEETCPAPVPPVVTQDICDIEKCLKELGEFALHNFDTAREACCYYNALVDETMDTFTMAGLKNLHCAQKERESLVKESLSNANTAVCRLYEMCKYLDCGVQASKTEIENTKALHREFKEKHKAARIEFQWENDKSLAKDRQWKMIEELMDKYANEMESLFPTLKLSSKKPVLQGDTDVLLYSTYRYIAQLSDELDDARAAMSERVNRAYDSLLQCTDEKTREAKLNAAIVKRRAEIAKEYKDRYEDQKQRNQTLLCELTKQQLAKHESSMGQKVEQQEKEVMACFTKMVDEKVEAERRVFANELANMKVKLEAVEQRLNARLKAERETRRSQTLWAAGSSLLAATKKGGEYVNVNKELNAIEKASDGEDKLVLTVLKSIPPIVREKGITPESVLKAKYKIMEDTALKVALVEEDGGPMPVYILSWLQAMLLFMKISGIPQKEYDKPPLEPSQELDTFDLLQRARYTYILHDSPLNYV